MRAQLFHFRSYDKDKGKENQTLVSQSLQPENLKGYHPAAIIMAIEIVTVMATLSVGTTVVPSTDPLLFLPMTTTVSFLLCWWQVLLLALSKTLIVLPVRPAEVGVGGGFM